MMEALRRFIDTYNRNWLVEKTASKAPGKPGQIGWPRTPYPGPPKKLVSKKTDAVQVEGLVKAWFGN